jgi:hypothetical protein
MCTPIPPGWLALLEYTMSHDFHFSDAELDRVEDSLDPILQNHQWIDGENEFPDLVDDLLQRGHTRAKVEKMLQRLVEAKVFRYGEIPYTGPSYPSRSLAAEAATALGWEKEFEDLYGQEDSESGPVSWGVQYWITTKEVWLRRLAERRSAAGAAPDQAKPAPPRLTVDLARKQITLDERTYDVRSDLALRWVKVLADRPGEWIAKKELPRYDRELLDTTRTDHLRNYLPQCVNELIESRTGAGSRLRT